MNVIRTVLLVIGAFFHYEANCAIDAKSDVSTEIVEVLKNAKHISMAWQREKVIIGGEMKTPLLDISDPAKREFLIREFRTAQLVRDVEATNNHRALVGTGGRIVHHSACCLFIDGGSGIDVLVEVVPGSVIINNALVAKSEKEWLLFEHLKHLLQE